ncbi:MAG: hypothetical protein HY465_03705 [Deltaproteobacteria bacterium]|nr:hypothetical protein [Deltaproteobacteria bacterium]
MGNRVLELEESYHPTSSYWHAPAIGMGFAAVEWLKIGLEEAGHPKIANAIGTLDGSPGVIGLTVDLFRASEYKNKPYTPPRSSKQSRIFLAAGAGTVTGLGFIPDPNLRYAFAGTAALRRSFIETVGYAIDGDIPINPHAAMIASGLVMLGRSAIPYWGNPPPADGNSDGELFLNAVTDTAGETAWEFGSSMLAAGIHQLSDGERKSDFWAYPKKRIVPSLVPSVLRNIYAQPIKPNAERIKEAREAARHAGFNLDPILGEKVQFRRASWDDTYIATAGVPLFLDARPSITFAPAAYSNLLWSAPRLSFQEAWSGTERIERENAVGIDHEDFMELAFYETAVHEALHLGASYGFYAQGPDGQFRLYGGEGPILHHLKFLFGSVNLPHHKRPGERVENEWSWGFDEELFD